LKGCNFGVNDELCIGTALLKRAQAGNIFVPNVMKIALPILSVLYATLFKIILNLKLD
jgi:hypothetical protein